jgi:hypothetical protein
MAGIVRGERAVTCRRETIEAKAARYLAEGRLEVLFVAEESARVRASCRGGDGIYSVTCDRGGWSCSCPARVARCAHVVAAELVAPRSIRLRRWSDAVKGGSAR